MRLVKSTAVSCVDRLVTAVERAAGISDSAERATAAAAVLNDFELEIMTESSGVDVALIKACRVLAAQVTRRRASGDTEEARRCREALAADSDTCGLSVDQVCNALLYYCSFSLCRVDSTNLTHKGCGTGVKLAHMFTV
jgi:hypothetical protein